MPDSFDKFAIPLFILAILGNILGYWIKNILKKNNYPVSYFFEHFRDVKNIFRLAKASNSQRYRNMGYGMVAFYIAFAGLFISLVLLSPSFNDGRCYMQKEFNEATYDAVINSKYIDSTNHSYQTLRMEAKDGTDTKNTDLGRDYSGIYDYLQVGDTLRKPAGTDSIRVINSATDTLFVVNFGCEKK